MHDWLQRVWYQRGRSGIVLVPLSWLFALSVALRRWLYSIRVLRSFEVGRPVVVVGNVTVGGTGKTPLTLWIAERFAERGRRVGIAMRGYGASASAPRLVALPTTATEVGDEALLAACRNVALVAVGHDRVAVARLLVDQGCDLIILDDGLQHLRMQRQYEIAVVDAERGFGNGRLLPAGPLREPASRLDSVDAVVINGSATPVQGIRMTLDAHEAISLADGRTRRPLGAFKDSRVHAIAGIGNPGRFFATLRAHGLDPIEHAFPDHAALRSEDIVFDDGLAVLMTEKDAVRCAASADARHWFVPVSATFTETDAARLLGGISKAAERAIEAGAEP